MWAEVLAAIACLDHVPLAWRIYTVLTLGAALIVILLNVFFVVPLLARETWEWIHDALRKPDVDRSDVERARMNVVTQIAQYRSKGARL